MELNETLRKARTEAGFLQRDVAAALGMTIGHYSNIESGRRPVRIEMIPNLPKPIRHAVALHALAQLEDRRDYLKAIINDATDGTEHSNSSP